MDYLTPTAICQKAAEHGLTISVRQLERWRYTGLLPAGLRHGLGRRRGTIWVYHPSVVERVLLIGRLRAGRHSLAEIGIRVWLAGEDLPISRVRAFASRAIPLARLKRKIRRLGPAAAGERFADEIERKPASRERWGASDWSEETYDVMAGFGEVLSASLVDPAAVLPKSAVATVKTAMHITPDQEEAVSAVGADVSEQIREGLPAFAGAYQILTSCSDGDLIDARKMCLLMSDLVVVMRRLYEFVPHPLLAFTLNAAPKSGMKNSDGFVLALAALIRAREDGAADPLQNVRTLHRSIEASVAMIEAAMASNRGEISSGPPLVEA